MTAAALPAGEPAENRCPECREKGVMVVRSAFGPEVAIEEGPYPYGTLVVAKLGGVWGVRDYVRGESVPRERLRRRHVCASHPYRCMAPGCTFGARLFAGGTFCEDHRPRTIALCR